MPTQESNIIVTRDANEMITDMTSQFGLIRHGRMVVNDGVLESAIRMWPGWFDGESVYLDSLEKSITNSSDQSYEYVMWTDSESADKEIANESSAPIDVYSLPLEERLHYMSNDLQMTNAQKMIVNRGKSDFPIKPQREKIRPRWPTYM